MKSQRHTPACVVVLAIAVAVTWSGAAVAQEPAKPAAPQKRPAASDGNKVLPSVRRDLAADPTLIVFDIVPERGIDRGLANALTEVVIDRVSKLKRYSVIGQKDLDKMMSWEQNKQLKGCTDTSCLIQIAGAMGANYYVEGSIGAMGDGYFVTLKLMDTASVRIMERVTEQTKRDENAAVSAIRHCVDVIMGVKETESSKDAGRGATQPQPQVGASAPVDRAHEGRGSAPASSPACNRT